MGFDALTSAVRRVTSSEVSLVVLGDNGSKLRPASVCGLEPPERIELERGLISGGRDFLGRQFQGRLSADIWLDGGRVGTIHALRRGPGPFDNEDLIETFAGQASLALAIARRPPVADELLDTWALLDQLVLSAHSLRELGRALTEVLGPLFGGARVGVMLADHERSVLQMLPGSFGADEGLVASHRMSFFDPRSNSARVFTTGLPYISNTSAGDSSIRQEYVDVFGLRRTLTVPLRQVGVLHVADGEREFGFDDLKRAGALAPRIASIVELANTLFRARREQRVEETLSRTAVAVASGEGIHAVLPPALSELCEATEAGLVAFVPDDAAAIVARSEGATAPRPSPRDQRLERTVLREAGTDPGMRAYVVGPQKPGDPGWAAFYVPVALGQMRVGTLAALRVRGEPFTRAERNSFTRMANIAALNYATERYQQQRAELARLHERQRIADDLHDDVAQILFAAQLSLDSILEHDELENRVTERIAHARALLVRGDRAIRTVIHRLSRPSAADIATRLASVVCGVEDEFSTAIHLRVDDDASAAARNLGRPVSDALVKAAREALVNAAKHAGPCRVSITLEISRRNRLVLTVADDGVGPGPGDGRHRHGLASLRHLLREQGGQLRVAHGQTGGTTVTASVAADSSSRDSADWRRPRSASGWRSG